MRLPGRKQAPHGWTSTGGYRSILVPIVGGPTSHEAVHVAVHLASRRGGKVDLLRVLVVPAELPLDADFTELVDESEQLLRDAADLVDSYGVKAGQRLVRARHAGHAIAEEAARKGVDIVILGAPRSTHRTIFGQTVDYVLKNSPSRVMVAAGKKRWLPFDAATGEAPAQLRRIVVPVKLGPIGEEMLAAAVTLAAGYGATVEALHAILVPLELALDAPMREEEERAAAALAEAKLLGAERGVAVEALTVRTRSIGLAIVEQAERGAADVIVLGSAPRWRRQSRFFSPTVDYVLRKAPSEVLIVAFPQSAVS